MAQFIVFPDSNRSPLVEELKNCHACTCRAEAQRPVPGVGPLDASLMILGRNPGYEEDEFGLPFIGRGGQELDEWIDWLGLDRRKIYVTNLAKCYTTKDRPPKAAEFMVCADLWLKRELNLLPNVKVIVALGNQVTEFMLGKDVESTGSFVFFAARVKLGDREFDVLPVAHPGHIIRARTKAAKVYTMVLPRLKEYLISSHPEVYDRTKNSA